MAGLIFLVCLLLVLGVGYPVFMGFVWLIKRASGSRERFGKFMSKI